MRQSFDAAWRDRALAGDGDAIGRLADFALRPLYSFCLYRVGNRRDLCEEVVQETLLVALGRLDRYDPERSGGEIFGWLTGLARNEIRRILAQENLATSVGVLWERVDRELLAIFARLESEALPDEILERAETREVVNMTMSQLPPRYREALEAKYLVGRSVGEISRLLNTTEKAVESLLTRARKAFRETFLTLTRNLGVEADHHLRGETT